MQYRILKSCIWETKHLSTHADSSTDTKKNSASKVKIAEENKTFLAQLFYTFYRQKFSWKALESYQKT